MKSFWIILCLPLINGVSVSKSEVGKQVTSKRDAVTSTTPSETTTTVDKGEDYEEKDEENFLDAENEEADVNRLLEPVLPSRNCSHPVTGRYSKQSRRNKREYNRRSWTSELTGPNGVKVNITDPPYSKKWNCPGTADLIWLKPDGRIGIIEYGQVKDFVEKSWRGSFGGSIEEIAKITTQCLWKKYRYRKTQIANDVGHNDVTETLLFYGAPADDLTAKITEGFDERDLTLQSSVHGASFDLTSSSSKADTKTTANANEKKTMLLCRVVLGNVQTVTSASRFSHAPVTFDSIKQGDEYAIYRGEQIYPEYLITYT